MTTEAKPEVKPEEPKVVTPPKVEPAPVVPAAPIAATSAAPKPAQADDDREPEKAPAWLEKRLSQHEKSLVRKLGAESMEALEGLVKASKDKADAEKSEIQKLTEKAAKIPALEKERDDFAAEIASEVKTKLAALTPEQRSAVKDIAGDDTAKQLRTIRALTPTWATASAPAVADPVAPPAAPEARPKTVIPPAATTVPAPGAPQGSPPAGPVDHVKVLDYLDATNPIKSAAYYSKHKSAIDAQRAAAKKTSTAA